MEEVREACTATEMIPTIEMIPATEMTPNHHRNEIFLILQREIL